MQKKLKLPVLLWCLLVLSLFMGTMPALAAEAMTMDNLYFGIWPEYDSDDVLVIFSGTFVNNTGAPFQDDIVYYMPKGAKVNMVCETENGMVCQLFDDSEVEGDYTKVVWKPSRVVQPGEEFPVMFEYNFNKFTSPGERNFSVPLQSTFPLENVQVVVRQPLRSESFNVDPKPEMSNEFDDDQYGVKFTEHYYTINGLTPSEKKVYNISYNKDDVKPSVAVAQTGTDDNTSSNDGGGSQMNSTVAVLAGVVVVLLVAFIILAMRSNQVKAAPRSGVRRNTPVNRSRKSLGEGKGGKGTPMPKNIQKNSSQDEKKKIRSLLVDGKISEETYRQLMSELDDR